MSANGDPKMVAVTLESSFRDAMLDAVDRCKAELRYTTTNFVLMIGDLGASATARILLRGRRSSSRFARLSEEGRLDLSVESLVLLPKFEPLFSAGERAEARRRLDQESFDIEAHLASHGTARGR